MKRLRIIVCAKQVPDPEVPLAAIQIDPQAKSFGVSGHTEVINPFDENALEAALRIKDDIGAEVTVLSLGSGVSPTIMRKALAVGADNLVLMKDKEFENLESYQRLFADYQDKVDSWILDSHSKAKFDQWFLTHLEIKLRHVIRDLKKELKNA